MMLHVVKTIDNSNFVYWPILKKKFLEHLVALSEDDRRMRFFANLKDEALSDYIDRINIHNDHVCYIEDGTNVIGFLHAAKVSHGVYEIGVSVSSDRRHSGVGSALFNNLILWAQSTGVEKLQINCLSSNVWMNKLARKYCDRVNIVDYSERSGFIEFPGTVDPYYAMGNYVINGILVCDSAIKTALTETQEKIQQFLAAPRASLVPWWVRPTSKGEK